YLDIVHTYSRRAINFNVALIKNGIKRYVWVVDEFADNASSMMELFVYLIYIHIAKTVYCNHRRGLMIILSIKEM
ncbi:hypothetical protein KKB54_00260, partial [bacterium]|nr:hypothetical protein [bacterium]